MDDIYTINSHGECMLWIVGILATVVMFAALVIRSKLKDADDDY